MPSIRFTTGFVHLTVVFIALVCGGLGTKRTMAGVRPSSTVTQRKVYCPTSNEDACSAFNLGCELAEKGKLKLAKGSYLKAIQIDSGYCDAMDNLGLLYRGEGLLDSAVYWYRRSIATHPEGFVAHMNLGFVLRLQERYDEALDAYRQCIYIDSTDPEGFYGVGMVMFYRGDDSSALPLFERAERLYEATSPSLVSHSQYFQGICCTNLKRWHRAKELLQAVYEEFKDDATANYCLGLCFLRDVPSNSELARKYLKEAKKQGSNSAARLLNKLE